MNNAPFIPTLPQIEAERRRLRRRAKRLRGLKKLGVALAVILLLAAALAVALAGALAQSETAWLATIGDWLVAARENVANGCQTAWENTRARVENLFS